MLITGVLSTEGHNDNDDYDNGDYDNDNGDYDNDNGDYDNDNEERMMKMLIMMFLMVMMMMMMLIRLMVDFGPFLWTQRLENVDLRTMLLTFRLGVDLATYGKVDLRTFCGLNDFLC